MTDSELNSTRRAHRKAGEILAWKGDGDQGEVAVPSVNVEEKGKQEDRAGNSCSLWRPAEAEIGGVESE